MQKQRYCNERCGTTALLISAITWEFVVDSMISDVVVEVDDLSVV